MSSTSTSSGATVSPSVLPAVPRHLLPQRFAHLRPESPTKLPRHKQQEVTICASEVDKTIETLDLAFDNLDDVLEKAMALQRRENFSIQDERLLKKVMRDVQHLLDLTNTP